MEQITSSQRCSPSISRLRGIKLLHLKNLLFYSSWAKQKDVKKTPPKELTRKLQMPKGLALKDTTLRLLTINAKIT